MIKTFKLLRCAVLCFVLAGCAETSFDEATGKGSVAGLHANAGLSDVAFLIEEFSLGVLAYKGATAPAAYDNLTYRFNFDLPRPGATIQRVASRELDVVEGMTYLFVLAGTPASPDIFLWERAEREWDAAETVFDINVGHVNTTLGPVDVYIGAAGLVPVAGNQAATVAYGERAAAVEFAAGGYEVIITPQNDPATVLYQSTEFNVAAAQSYSLAILDADEGLTAPVSVRIIGSGGLVSEIPDARFAPTVQFVNASLDSGAIDVVIDGDFANPAVTNLAFGAVSADVELPAATANYQYVATGTTTAVLDEDATVIPGTRNMFVLTGDAGSETSFRFGSVRRGISTGARLRIINATSATGTLDLYLTEPGTVLEDVFANFSGTAVGFNTLNTQAAGDYEFSVTANGEKTRLAGPTALSLLSGDVVELLLLDTADPNLVDLLVFSNVNP